MSLPRITKSFGTRDNNNNNNNIMSDLSKKVFRGIRQVSFATYEACTDKEGYLWLVKDGDKRNIYFGGQVYADINAEGDEKEIQKKIDEAFDSFVKQDLLHSFDENGKLQNELSFEVTGEEEKKPILHLKGKDGADVATVDMSQFVVDGMIQSVEYDKENHTLVITWNTDAGSKVTKIDLSNLIDIYTAGNGIEVSDKGVISIKLDEATQSYLVLSENGLKLENVDGSHIELGKAIKDDKEEEVASTEKVTDVLATIFSTLKDVEDSAISVVGDGKSINVTDDAEKATKKILSLKSEESTKETVDNGHIEVVNNSENGVYGQMYYMTNVESVSGNITNGKVSGDSVSIYNATVKDDVRLNIVAEDDVEIEDLTFSGDFPEKTSNAIASINGGSTVTIKDMTFDSTVTGYNALEIGLSATECPKYINIENCNFNGIMSNNAILIFGTTDNAVINIKNCYFKSVSNVLRLSNKLNAKNVVVNVTDCSVDQWDTNPLWEGFLICEDYTSKSVEKEKENNLFGNGKITVNFTNLTYKGEKVMSETPNRVTYVYNDKGGTVTDADYVPVVTFK